MRKDKLAACHTRSTRLTDTNQTPPAFIEYLQNHFGVKFTIDIAASKNNAVCKVFFTEKEDALTRSWRGLAWCNPPYSKAYRFVARCAANALTPARGSAFVLLAARTDQDWWHDFAEKASHIIYIKGRLKFICSDGKNNGAPFPSVIFVFKKGFSGVTEHIYLAPTPYERGFQRGKPSE